MAKNQLLTSISLLSKKLDSLLIQHQADQQKIRILEAENEELKKMKEEYLNIISNKQKEIDFLSISHKLADSPEALVSARNNISRLIRTIDNCIRMIQED